MHRQKVRTTDWRRHDLDAGRDPRLRAPVELATLRRPGEATGCAGFVSCPIWMQMLETPAGYLPHVPVSRGMPAKFSLMGSPNSQVSKTAGRTVVNLDPRKTFCEEMDAENR